MQKCQTKYGVEEWRKIKSWHSHFKNMSRTIGNTTVSNHKDKEKNLQCAVNQYLTLAKKVAIKIENCVFDNLDLISKNEKLTQLIEEDLVYFMNMLLKHIDLLERRVIKGEIIPNSEKIYSIFETHTEYMLVAVVYIFLLWLVKTKHYLFGYKFIFINVYFLWGYTTVN